MTPPEPVVPSGSTLRLVSKNAGAPMAAALVNKALDIGFAILMLRLLGSTEAGRFTWAALVVGYFDVLINFGLGVLVTREVARNPQSADRFLGAALGARFGLWVVALVIALIVAGPLAGPFELTPAMGTTLVILVIGIGISSLAGLLSALFNANERMEFPAGVTVFTTICKVALGSAALLFGYGIVGLALASVLTNLLTAALLVVLAVRVLGRPRPTLNARLGFKLAREAYPLMINNMLVSIFFRIDGIMLRAMWGDQMLGWYGAAYKVVDGLNVIPSSFVLALFPMFARAGGAAPVSTNPGDVQRAVRPDLFRGTVVGLRVLQALAFPIAVGVTLLAEPIIFLFAGNDFLPHGAIALQALIWFVPFSFTNGLLQYVLIAVNRQHFITVAFLLAAGFNIIGNFIVIPHWGYVGASFLTVLSELVLLGPFLYAVRRHVGPLALLPIVWRPALAAAVMAPVVWLVGSWSALIAVPAGALVYGTVLYAVRGVTREEIAMLLNAWRRPTEVSA